MSDLKDVHPRTAVVSGSNRGTGRAIAEALVAARYRVVSINRSRSADPVGPEHLCDLADPAALTEALDEIRSDCQRVDLVVCNAATRLRRRVADADARDWHGSLMANIAAPALMVSALLPHLRRTAGLAILIGSHAADRFFEGGALYSSTKAGARALFETLLLEERPHGVRSMVISPGAIANREADSSPFKMSPDSIGKLVVTLAASLPADIAIGEVEIRPALLDPAVPTGMIRLQSV
ncbi:SDR family oxidoreductase [Actinoplanes teichomyceticus]|uniref:SDR family oxidoreductase n=1 Tax=Actinoplanes teichomyceticus TaxID=1867 RepID=UPI0013DE011B|nr:SDR family oxidoreductase [Actinoplanes teichomyceticus]